MIDVSILIPAYNAEAWIGAAIESALAQQGISTEVIVADDGSSDGTVAAVRRFGDRVRCEALPHAGGNAARNRLLELSRGRWLQYLDADDYLLPGKIERQFASLRAGESDVSYGPVWVEIWKEGRAVGRTLQPIDASLDLATQWILWQLPQTGGPLFRREALERIGGWNQGMPCCQEHELYLRALQAGLKFTRIPDADAGAVYRIWSEETVCRKDPALVVRTRTRLIDEMLAWLEKEGTLREAHLQAAGTQFFEMARTLARDDVAAASAYFAARGEKGLLRVAGPAAPWRYRAALAIGGFSFAEKLARIAR